MKKCEINTMGWYCEQLFIKFNCGVEYGVEDTDLKNDGDIKDFITLINKHLRSCKWELNPWAEGPHGDTIKKILRGVNDEKNNK